MTGWLLMCDVSPNKAGNGMASRLKVDDKSLFIYLCIHVAVSTLNNTTGNDRLDETIPQQSAEVPTRLIKICLNKH